MALHARGIATVAAVAAASMLIGWTIARSGATSRSTATGSVSQRDPYGHPNLNGIWQALNTANWDLEPHAAEPGPPQLGTLLAIPAGLGVVEGGEIPYTPQGLARKKENASRRWKDDPEAKCYLPGIPRFNYLPFPFQILQGPDTVTMASEYAGANRTIHLTPQQPPPVESWMGQATGRFEGDTLIVEVAGLNGQAWLDRAGNYASENARITERYTIASPDRLLYEARIEDPTVYAEPWTMRMPLHRRTEPNAQLLEFRCVEFAEEFLYGDLKKKTR